MCLGQYCSGIRARFCNWRAKKPSLLWVCMMDLENFLGGKRGGGGLGGR